MRRMYTKKQLKAFIESWTKSEIDDDVISSLFTWSSSKINSSLPKKTSDLTNDSGFTTESQLLESGKIKTSLLPVWDGE